jgi:hypothetical protein
MSEDDQRALREAEAVTAEAVITAYEKLKNQMRMISEQNDLMELSDDNYQKANAILKLMIEFLILLKNMIDHIDNTLLDGFSKSYKSSNKDERNDYAKKIYSTKKKEEYEKLRTEFDGKEIDFRNEVTSEATFKNRFLFASWGRTFSSSILPFLDDPIITTQTIPKETERKIISLFISMEKAKLNAPKKNRNYNEELDHHPIHPSNNYKHNLLLKKLEWLDSEKSVLESERDWAAAMIDWNDNIINKNALDLASAAYKAADERVKATRIEISHILNTIELFPMYYEAPTFSSRAPMVSSARTIGSSANLLKRKSGGMVTRKKKYRKRNKTKRNKRQKKTLH